MSTVETGIEIRQFHAEIPDAEIADLRRRLAATRWPDKETVSDASQGVQLAKLKGLVEYWATDYDWRKGEEKLNSLPQFITEIDGLDIHFIHVHSSHDDAMPLIITHGWPGSVFELLKIVEPLTEPPPGEDAFHVVIPSLPGFGFSARPEEPGWNPDRIARAWDELMKRLGYEEYVAQGGDWGAVVTEAMGRQAPSGLRAIHVNLPASVPPDVEAALNGTGPVPEMTEEEQAVFDGLVASRKSGFFGYFLALTARPQDVGYGVTDSPAGLAALFFWHPGFATWSFGSDPNDPKSKDEVLDDISLYWLTNTAASSGRLYWEHGGAFPTSAAALKVAEIAVPVGVTVFGEDGFRPPESWTRRAYPTLTYFNKVERGGHFAAWEQPQLFADEVRATFKEVR
ncbi:MAG TPA: epoxide hydrolase [Gaiellaceae bacterium]|nr:epoxide hydrolase [Gaiellaceae bacterium]